jgi:hypothetical protein
MLAVITEKEPCCFAALAIFHLFRMYCIPLYEQQYATAVLLKLGDVALMESVKRN